MRDVLHKVHDVWGIDPTTAKKTTPDDIVRVFGILLTDPDVIDYVSDITGDMKGGDWPQIDASKGRVLAYYQLMVNKFVDEEVIIKLPEQWTQPSTREKVNNRTKEGSWEKYGQFNPNNHKRMKLPWLPHDMKVNTIVFIQITSTLKDHF